MKSQLAAAFMVLAAAGVAFPGGAGAQPQAGELSANPQPTSKKQKAPSGCINVNPRWFLCGKITTKEVRAGGGFRFMEVDPSGNISAQKSYESCDGLRRDRSLSEELRTQAARRCDEHFTPRAEQPAQRGSP